LSISGDTTPSQPEVVSMSSDTTLRHHDERTVSDLPPGAHTVAGAVTSDHTSAPCVGRDDRPPVRHDGEAGAVSNLVDIVVSPNDEVVSVLIDKRGQFSSTKPRHPCPLPLKMRRCQLT